MNGYPIFFEAPPAIGTTVSLTKKVTLRLCRVGMYRNMKGVDVPVLEWATHDGRTCTSGLRAKSVYWRTIEEANEAADIARHRRMVGV